ncbi:sugar transferase [Hanamia caeni]|jgi:lipopolysaccharide/colanic/teichoic acid biosynthesis glycosyltransferase|uniref:Sugar transferase n=1 Tax=Hanamia caeni TaxID=2294116 RepID=A0A3M9NDC0_9BACT|nr:sugar transferase [Hanamia caeni]RNI35203.1 sugar transferase [Hanamia caeni]
MIRFFDVVFSFVGLVVLLPFFVIIYLLIIIESKGGGFFTQQRVGRNGVDFNLIKFRSMRIGSDKKGLITVGEKDPRATKMGMFIRKFKIDELPQLFNVLKGEMSVVGPRPEVRRYVNLYNTEQLKVLSVRPGITDYASIEYAEENKILGSAVNPEKVYVEQIMPHKIQLNMKYIQNRSLKEYFKVIFLTIFQIFNKK